MGEDSSHLSGVIRKIVNRALPSELVVQDILLPRSQVVVCDLDLDIKKPGSHEVSWAYSLSALPW